MIHIHAYKAEAACEYSDRTGEAVEISTDDGSITHAVISLTELAKLLRFRQRQETRQNGQSRSPPNTLSAGT